MTYELSRTGKRRLVTGLVFALAVAATAAVNAQVGQPLRDACAAGEPQGRITACTQILGRGGLDRTATIAAYVNRGNAYDALDQPDLAMKDFQAAVALDGDDGLALRSRAGALARRGRLQEAIADLSHEITLRPEDTIAIRARGTIQGELGLMKPAIEDFSKVLDREPGDLAARELRGLALASLGEHARAILDFNRILGRDPRSRVARAARAFSLFRTRQYRLAVVDWDQILARDPDQPAVLYCRGAAKLLGGDEAGGRADIASVQQQKPDVAAAQAAVCPPGVTNGGR